MTIDSTEEDHIASATVAFQCLIGIRNQLETILCLLEITGEDLGDDYAKELFDIIEPLYYRVDIMNNRYAALIPTAMQQ